MTLLRTLFSCLALLLASSFTAAPAAEPTELDYRTDVAPLLRDYCAGCHNQREYEGDFSVETFAELMAGGETEDRAIVVPGKPDESYLFQTIAKTARPSMPPQREPQLDAEEIELLARWIREGAKGPAPEDDLSLLSTLSVPEIPASGAAPSPVTALALSPDAGRLAVGRFGEVEIRDAESGESLVRFPAGEGKVNALHFSPDGSRLAVATGISGLKGYAEIRDAADGELLLSLGEGVHRDILFDAEFSPDGRLLATAGYDATIALWELPQGESEGEAVLLREMPSHNGAIYDLAFSPDGSVLASASGDSTSKLWLVETGERLDTLNQPEGEQYRIAFTPDGRHVLGIGADRRIRLWRFLSRSEPRINPVAVTRFGHEDAVVEMAVSPGGEWVATASADLTVKRWRLPDLEPMEVSERQPEHVSALVAREDGSLIVARLDGSIETLRLDASSQPDQPDRQEVKKAPGTVAPAPVEAEDGAVELLALGASAEGVVAAPGGFVDHAFEAAEGETWIFEIDAARSESPLDSHIAVLDAAGEPVERAVLQAVRDSWLTFRGKDSATSQDFRVHNWEEMELNEYLYLNGEVVKLWLYPRGPDSGFIVYPGFGDRHTYFDTTALSHPMGQPCQIVRAYPAGTDPIPNGLPVYRLHYENDDDPRRELGSDSRLTFTAPATGRYLLRVRDVRGFGGEDHRYRLSARAPAPDFEIEIGGKNPKLSPGSGRELTFTAKRHDGFEGPIRLRVEGLPESLRLTRELEIEAGQYRAFASLSAPEGFEGLDEEAAKAVRVVASAEIGGRTVEKDLGGLGAIEAGEEAEFRLRVEADPEALEAATLGEDGVLELALAPGETISARVAVERLGMDGEIRFGTDDSGRNLPHGVYIDNIGLSGLLILEGRDHQDFAITAAPWVSETVREFHLLARVEGNHATVPVRLRVLPALDGDNLSGDP